MEVSSVDDGNMHATSLAHGTEHAGRSEDDSDHIDDQVDGGNDGDGDNDDDDNDDDLVDSPLDDDDGDDDGDVDWWTEAADDWRKEKVECEFEGDERNGEVDDVVTSSKTLAGRLCDEKFSKSALLLLELNTNCECEDACWEISETELAESASLSWLKR